MKDTNRLLRTAVGARAARFGACGTAAVAYAAAVIWGPTDSSLAAVLVWNQSTTDWAATTAWTPNGTPTAADTLYFDPTYTSSDSTTKNAILTGAQVALQVNLYNNFLASNYALTGASSGTLTLGSSSTDGTFNVAGIGTTAINNLALAGFSSTKLLTFNVTNDAVLSLTGSSSVSTNVAMINLSGGGITADNTASNTTRFASATTVAMSSGSFSFQGSAAGSTASLGRIYSYSGTNTVTVGNVGSAATTLAVSGNDSSLRDSTAGVITFTAANGTLGSANGARVTFATALNTNTYNGLLANSSSATALTSGFATVTDNGGKTFASYSASNGIVAATPTTTLTSSLSTITGTPSKAYEFTQFNAPASTTVTPGGTVYSAAMRITPQGTGGVLALGGNNTSLTAIMLDGANDYTISGTTGSSTLLNGGATRYIYVNNPQTALSTTASVTAGTSSATNFAGPGILSLTGTANQLIGTSSARFNILGGVVRSTRSAIQANAVNGSATSQIALRGGVIELVGGSNATGAAADFTRPLSSTTGTDGTINWYSSLSNDSVGGSGGFSAFGDAASVNIGGAVTPSKMTWDSTGGFVKASSALLFGSVSSNNTLTWLNPIGLDGGTAGTYLAREIRVTKGAGSVSDKTVLAGVISGSSSTDFTKTGDGTLTLSAANTYAGKTVIQAGTLQVGNGGTTGTLGNGAVINNGALVFNRTNDLTVSAVISGSGTVSQVGGGVLTLSGSNTFTGLLSITGGGTVRATSFNSLVPAPTSAGAAVTLNNGTLQLIGNTTNNNLNRQISLTSAGGTLDIAATKTFEMSARIINASSGNGTLIKSGAGKLLLTNVNNTWAGSTSIRNGTLQVGAADSPGAKVVNTTSISLGDTGANGFTGTLAGYGAVNPGATVTVNSNGTITAGTGAASTDTPGKLTTGGQQWNAGGQYVWKTLASSGTAGTTWDLLNMGTLSGASGFTVKAILGNGGIFNPSSPYSAVQTFQIAHTTNTADIDVEHLFVLDTTGLGVSTTAGSFTLSFDPGSDGYDLNLNFQSAPEPTTAGLVGLATSSLLGRRRRRKGYRTSVLD